MEDISASAAPETTEMMNRRAFLLASVQASAAGLVVGTSAYELWDRLSWKRTMFPSADIQGDGLLDILPPGTQLHGLSSQTYADWSVMSEAFKKCPATPDYEWLGFKSNAAFLASL